MSITRRGFIGLAAVVALGRLPGERARAAPLLTGYPFRLGVASGDPRSDGVVLWTRLAPEPLADDGFGGMPPVRVPVRWELAEDENFRRVVRRGDVAADPDLAHSVHVEVDGLRPGREYWYRFAVRNDISAVGRTKTAGDVPAFKLALVSCQDWAAGFYTAYRHLAAEGLDLVVHLGDYIYELGIGSTGGVRGTPLSSAHNAETLTLDQYRLRYSLVNSDPDLQAALASAPFAVTLDDHDVQDNWAGDTEPTGMTPENFLRRRAAAFRAAYENLPLRASSLPIGPDMRMHRRLDYGRLASLYVLDTRQFRSPLDIGAREDPRRTLLGSEQERWLLDGLGRSRATWNALANQVMMFQLDRLTDPGLQQLNPDTWDGYAAARDRLLGGIVERRVRNPVVLTGDAHVNCAADLKADFNDPASATISSEFVGTSITSGRNGADMTAGGREWLAANPHLKFFNSQRGYVRCHATEREWRADYLVADRVTTPGGTVSVRRSFVVEDGKAGLQDA